MSETADVRGTLRRSLRALPTLLAIPMAVLTSAALVTGTTTAADGFPSTPVGTIALAVSVVAIPIVASIAVVGAWRNDRRIQWAATGGLLIFGIVPFGAAFEVVLVGILVLLGLLNTAPDRRWYDVWLALALLVSLWGIGSLLVVYTPGHGGVMVVVGATIVFGATVSVLAAGSGTLSETRRSLASRDPAEGIPSRIVSGVASGPEWRPAWIAIAFLSLAVTTFHFLGLAWGTYTRYWFWDAVTHSLSGFGVAGIVYLLRPSAFTTPRRLFSLLPALVFTIGAVFEVYEYAFREFYVRWSIERYLTDTISDLGYDTLGALAFACFPYARHVGSGPDPLETDASDDSEEDPDEP
ncbi:hypothetical protein [Halorubrum cibi]|uniref:Uncharacterized protein n=1 Tax=Halorubrum cibi TaxID=413815 RepID=A0A521BM49_9EURY|nr:hypothetical protein [Halorubrum cibi]SMO48179.1 hypothetical protein SAMN06264867_102339 [Halorubrum cibi]